MEGRMETTGGEIYYEAVGEGKPVVLLHSMTLTSEGWKDVLSPLSERYAVYALDLPGHGRSSHPQKYPSMSGQAAAVMDFMAKKGIDKASLIGNALGSAVAVELCAEHPSTVERLVLVGCGAFETEAEKNSRLEVAKAQFDGKGHLKELDYQGLSAQFTRLEPSVLEMVNRLRKETRAETYLEGFVALANYPLFEKLTHVKCPTLVVYGDKDSYKPKEQPIMASLQNARSVTINGASHMPQVDRPDEFVQVVQDFLES